MNFWLITMHDITRIESEGKSEGTSGRNDKRTESKKKFQSQLGKDEMKCSLRTQKKVCNNQSLWKQ